MDHHDAVREAEHFVEILRDQHDARAARPRLEQAARHLRCGPHVEPAGGLIGEDQTRFGVEHPGEDQLLDIAARQQLRACRHAGAAHVILRCKALRVPRDGLAPQRIDGNITVRMGGDEDLFVLTALNDRDPADGFLVDGQGAADEYRVVRNDAAVSYVVDFVDSGGPADGADILTIEGRDPEADEILIRRNFVALLNPDGAGGYLGQVERLNYGADMNGRVRINGLGGDDRFYVDDTGTMFTLDGGAGDDRFQIGQLFGADRVAPNVAAGDEIETNETTQGFLSVGSTHPMLVYGGDGEDQFTVYSNKAATKLFGEAGNDTFVVRAFVLKSDPTKTAGGGSTDVFGGDGDDSILYNINAPLSIDGGAGVDTVVVLGTEVADAFLITEGGIYGAGLNVGFAGVEKAKVDGLEGDDTFYVASTAANMVLTIIGGLGSDTINVAGDVTQEIVALEVEGTSSVVNHSSASTDPAYNEIFVRGLRANAATGDSALFEIDTSGLAVLDEGGVHGEYRVRMTQAIASTVYLTVSAARSSTADRSLPGTPQARSALVSLAPGGDYRSAQVLTFSNTTDWQTIYVQAPQDGAAEGTRDVVLSHSATGTAEARAARLANVEVTVYDDDADRLLVAGDPSELTVAEGGAPQSVSLTLSRAPGSGDVVYTLDMGEDVILFSADPRFTAASVGAPATATFTEDDWDAPLEVTLTAVDDTEVENRERQTLTLELDAAATTAPWADDSDPQQVQVFIADDDKGEVLITETGGDTIVSPGNPDSYSMVLTRAPTAPVEVSVLTDGRLVASSADPRFSDGVVTFTAADWNTPVTIDLAVGAVTDPGPQPTVKVGAQPQRLDAIRGPLYIEGGVDPDADRALQVGVILPSETDVPLPVVTTPTDETQQTDRLVMFDAGNAVGMTGVLTEDRLTGFGMRATDLQLNVGTPSDPILETYAAGISYEALEVVELLMGQADDSLAIESTAEGAITVVHGGGGSDTITLRAGEGETEAIAGGPDRTLAIFGDTTQKGERYTTRTGEMNGTGRVFAAPGDDVIDASAASGFVLAYGGVGDDTITGSAHDDHILGGSGSDVLHAGAGRDHVYGDNGLNIDLSVRSDLQPQLVSIATEQPPGDPGYEAQTGDPLTQTHADSITGNGDNVILADFGVIEQAANVNRAFDTGSITRISTVREDEGSDDTVSTGAGADWVLTGGGRDSVTSSGGDDVVIADVGQLTVLNGSARGEARSSADAPELGGDDTVNLGDGDAWVIAAAGADSITVGNGEMAILGDAGRIEADAAGNLVQIETLDHVVGGVDTITGGDGAKFVFGGRDGDVIALGDGDHVVAGDVGRLDFEGGVRSEFVSAIETPSYDGDDTVSTGRGDTWVILGGGDDVARAGGGLNIVLGDAGYVEGDATGRYVRAETTQPRTGGDDSIFGGDGRDIQFGGAGRDYLEGGAGDDFISGDGALITRAKGGLITVESRDIRDGGDDTLIGDAGFDVMMGGIGDDTFDLEIADDIVVGEFVRLRLQPQSGGRDLVVSFLTPAVRDLDLLAQITLGVNFASGRSVVTPVTGPSVNLSRLADVRLDLVMAENDAALRSLLAALFDSGLDGEDDGEWAVPGLFGFGGLSSEVLLTTAPPPDIPQAEMAPEEPPAETEETPPAADEEQGGTAPPLEEARLGLDDADVAAGQVGQPVPGEAAQGGWRMTGWRVATDAA